MHALTSANSLVISNYILCVHSMCPNSPSSVLYAQSLLYSDQVILSYLCYSRVHVACGTHPGSASPTTAASSVLPSPSSAASASPQQTTPTQQLVNMSNLTSITQLPGLVYPLQMPTVLTAQGAVNNIGGTGGGGGGEAKKLSGE